MITRRKALTGCGVAACGAGMLAQLAAEARSSRAATPDPWAPLMAELERWRAAGRTAPMWWRNDDTGDVMPSFRRLMEVVRRRRVPVALAVTPAYATKTMADAVASVENMYVIQHGYAHVNHAPAGKLECELNGTRSQSVVEGELLRGMKRLRDLFGARFVPVLAPPWYCLPPALAARLPALGYAGVSLSHARKRRNPVPGLVEANGHVEMIDWKTSPPRCNRTAVNVGYILVHLSGKRRGIFEPTEPTGIVTHHHALDENCWTFLEELFDRLGRHPAVAWQSPTTVFMAGSR